MINNNKINNKNKQLALLISNNNLKMMYKMQKINNNQFNNKIKLCNNNLIIMIPALVI